jgi:hypothetical protein
MCLKPKGFIESSTLGAIMNGRRGGCLYMYCLPPKGVLHSQNKEINAPPTASHKGGVEVWFH